VDRTAGERGFCRAGNVCRISSIFPHHGEEPPLSGTGGSGTVFFSNCTLKCIFCQNYQISHEGEGEEYAVQRLAVHLLELQNKGCHNINLVTPSHYLPWILESLREAWRSGLSLPVVYNCGGYETGETLAVLKDVVDIYLPDMKYGDNGAAHRYSGVPDYAQVNQAAVREMFHQAGPLRLDKNGVAYRGLVIRHLVLPCGEAGSEKIRRFLVDNFDPGDITLSIMAQYRPLYRACEYEKLARTVTAEEYLPVRDAFIRDGFGGFYQEITGLNESFVIDFKKRKFDELIGE
jgi:putative pyruvate formate lyase activating enzyme